MKFKDFFLQKLNTLPVGNDIASIRIFLLDSVVGVFSIFGALAVVMGGVEVYLQEKPEVMLVYIAVYLPFLCCWVFRKKISFSWRAGVILLDLYVFSLLVLAGVGLSGAGIHLLMLFTVLTTTFVGIKGGLVSVGMSVAAILATGTCMVTGVLSIDMVAMTSSTRIEAWFTAAVLYLIIGGGMVVCPGLLQSRLQKTLGVIQKRTAEINNSNSRLKQALKERKEMEGRLVRAEKMEAMGLLAGGVAHDLNNILTGVITYPELLLLNMSKEDDLYEPLKVIKSSGEKAAAIVRDLLTLSRRGVNVKETLNLNLILEDCFQSPECDKLFQFHPDVAVTMDLDPELANISGSTVHVSNVVMNLISNAAEAMADGGKLHVATRNLVVETPVEGYEQIPENDYVVLTVKDTGHGISAGDFGRIFEPFYTKKKMGRSGTGLGMAIVYGSVKDHNGYIDVKTEQEKGTEFTLYFPRTAAPLAGEDIKDDWQVFRGKNETVLFVDDVKEQRDLGARILKDLDYRPVCFDSGEKAVEFCNGETPDIIIVDMIMDPGIDGYETLKRIRTVHPDLPAIILSGYAKTNQVKSSLNLGQAVFLKKPYKIESLARAVRQALDGQ
ncbi:MAG: ATP-binding protein [Desulfobacteraceae bacterium]